MNMKNFLSRTAASFIVAGGLVAAGSVTAQASAYMLSEGQNMYTTGFTYSTATDWFNQNRNRVPQGCTSKDYSWNNSYTYGYSYYTNLFASASLANQACGAGAKSTGLGDVTLGIRGRLDITRNGRTWELAAIIPTGYDAQRINRLGYGKFGLWGGVAFSSQNTGWEEKAPSYWEVGTGLNYWFGSPATQWKSYAKWSWRLDEDGVNRIVLKGTLKLSLRDHTPEPIPAAGGFFRNSGDYDAGVIQASYARRVSDQWTVGFGVGETIWGRNVSASRFADISFTYSWDD
ncbi:hypothetical protein Ga0123462_0588 [Mariprofundus ferrinatatus]|uniref:MetA-pathway of phenol degradation n=1 Tax=Mariprofundus ferrinatatus TaxID=1921087 RepID=A0A2K8L2C1_9PROT|nr:hypothetical protein [Mariprofundus ferrinatatus]ATX81458.1 hypothetical protein Ga0123462_0588 [Mariprofundus ferrinatatus]